MYQDKVYAKRLIDNFPVLIVAGMQYAAVHNSIYYFEAQTIFRGTVTSTHLQHEIWTESQPIVS